MSDEGQGQEKIPTSKVARATRFLKTGAKVGRNYVSHYSRKAFSEVDDNELDKKNAEEILSTLSEMKGSVLKVAQMLSMDSQALPQEYLKKFAEAQYSAPPLSYPLVVKTFRQYFGEGPESIYDSFSRNAIHAASIGQVHQAEKDGKKLAVKIQYPGVADSIDTDLRIVKPLATRIANIRPQDVEHYFEEVRARLIEETDYVHELTQAVQIGAAFKGSETLVFPTYYPEYSNDRILTMDWIEGVHLDKFIATDPDQETRNRVGQALWDFYDYQIHSLRKVHADPHPGNFLVTPDEKIAVLDFGCVKDIPDHFYTYFMLLFDKDLKNNDATIEKLMLELQFLYESDRPDEKEFFFNLFKEGLELIGRPVHQGRFDFSDESFFQEVFENGQRISKMKQVRQSKVARGPKDGIYISRVYYGLFGLLHQLGATVDTARK